MGVTLEDFAWTSRLDLLGDDFDRQGHLNNAAIARLCNDLRVAYIQANIGEPWIEWLRNSGAVVAAREVHISYVSEGFPGEEFVGATRITRRDGRAAIVEQRIVEAVSGRVVADAWVVQLLVLDGQVVDWPAFYWDLVERAEGRPVPYRISVPRPPWGPPAWEPIVDPSARDVDR